VKTVYPPVSLRSLDGYNKLSRAHSQWHACTDHHREQSTSNISSDSGQVHYEPVLDLKAAGLAGVVKTAKSLVTNAPYMFSVLFGTFDAIIVNGFVAFGVKYLQQQFTLNPAMAGIIFGQSLHLRLFVCLLLARSIHERSSYVLPLIFFHLYEPKSSKCTNTHGKLLWIYVVGL